MCSSIYNQFDISTRILKHNMCSDVPTMAKPDLAMPSSALSTQRHGKPWQKHAQTPIQLRTVPIVDRQISSTISAKTSNERTVGNTFLPTKNRYRFLLTFGVGFIPFASMSGVVFLFLLTHIQAFVWSCWPLRVYLLVQHSPQYL